MAKKKIKKGKKGFVTPLDMWDWPIITPFNMKKVMKKNKKK